jgi:nucleotide-binding universal stress UspA family protein
MYSKIIVGYDGSDHATDALAFGKQLARATGAELVVSEVSVVHPMMRTGVDPVALEGDRQLAREVDAAAEEAGATSRHADSSSVARGLHELAEEIGADLVVVGSSRYGTMGQTLLGNVAVSLMHGSPCAAAVAPSGYRDRTAETLSTVVVGYDGSPESRLALESACDLARAAGARLLLVAAAEPPPVVYGKSGGMTGGWAALKEELERELREQLDAAKASLPADVSVETKVADDEPAPALANEARAPGSILVVGSRAYGPVRRVLLGSVSRALARLAPAPLVVLPRLSHAEFATTTRAEASTTA